MRYFTGLFLFFALLFSTSSLLAEKKTPSPVQIRLLSETKELTLGKEVLIGIEFIISKDWHLYWKNPGGPGFAPQITWQLPKGFTTTKLRFPPPGIFKSAGEVINYGYEKKLLLLTKLTPPTTLEPAKKYRLKANIDWLMCNPESCLPGSKNKSLTFSYNPSQETATETAHASLLRKAETRLPEQIKSSSFSLEKKKLLLHIPLKELAFPNLKEGEQLYFFPETPEYIDSQKPQEINILKENIQIALPLLQSDTLPNKLQGILALTSKIPTHNAHPPRWAQFINAPKKELAPVKASSIDKTFLTLLAYAALGGLLLNLMPCVFPVLSLKTLHFVEISKESRKKLLFHGIAYLLGVLLFFLLLAGILLLLREGGQQLGWGFQLQEPLFVMFLGLLLFIFSLSMLGFYEFGLSVAQKAGTAESQNSSHYFSSFKTGALATLLATPCTGPFLGSVFGFALKSSPTLSLLLFSSIGLGMALPTLLLCLFPKLLKILPRPGAWMETFKQILAFPMLLVFLWLLKILTEQLESHPFSLYLLSLLTVVFLLWVLNRYASPIQKKSTRLIAKTSALLLTLLALALTLEAGKVPIFQKLLPQSTFSEKISWQPYSEETLHALLEKKRPVFIDFTASWCATCQVSKLAFKNKKVIQLITRKNIALLRADWTNHDPKITQALAQHNRASVPLYLYYRPTSPNQPQILPLSPLRGLTPKTLLNTFQNP